MALSGRAALPRSAKTSRRDAAESRAPRMKRESDAAAVARALLPLLSMRGNTPAASCALRDLHKRWLAHPAHLLLVRLSKLTLQCAVPALAGEARALPRTAAIAIGRKGMRRSLCAWVARNLGWAVRAKARAAARLGAYAVSVATLRGLRHAVRLDHHLRDGNMQKIAPTHEGPGHTSRRDLGHRSVVSV
jgi:hypothetical protein